jgi:uncharacterized protein (TIGR02265 family)
MGDRKKAVSGSERRTNGTSVNELLKSLAPEGDFAEAVRKAGYDSRHPAEEYSFPVFLKILDLLRLHLYPSLPPSEGYRKLGRRTLANHFEAGIGSRIGAKALPIMGPDGFIKNYAKFANTRNSSLVAEASKKGDKHWHLSLGGTGGVPGDYFAGAIECALEMAGAPSGPKIVVSNAGKEQLDLDITW